MEKFLAQRFDFCDFSKIVGFPNPLPSREEWECSLPKFKGKEGEVPVQQLLYFHDFIHQPHIVHEDVHIKPFRYSLKRVALHWCRSLLVERIDSLHNFHAAFHSFFKDHFLAECLYENCCDEFLLFYEDSASQENHISDEAFTAEESICYEYLEVLYDIHYESCSTETSGITSDIFTLLDVHKDQHVSLENFDVKEQFFFAVDISPGYGDEIDVVCFSGKVNTKGIFVYEINKKIHPCLRGRSCCRY
jgi:hypothetical protein